MADGEKALIFGGIAAAGAWLYLEQRKKAEAEQAATLPNFAPYMQRDTWSDGFDPYTYQAQQQPQGARLTFDPSGLLAFGLDALFTGLEGRNTGGTPPIINQGESDMRSGKSSNTGFGNFLSSIFGGTASAGSSGATAGAGSSGASAGSSGASSSTIGGRLVNDLMRDFGLTRTQAAGVVGNLDHESAGFGTLQEVNPIVPGSRGGFGYAQWTGPRRREFEAWAAARGLDPTSYEANYGFLNYEMSSTWESRVVPQLKRTTTVEDSARVFQDVFLRPGIPHTQSRIDRAKRYL